MTVLVTSDWHLNDNPRDRYRHEWVRKHLPKLIGDHGVYTVVMLGDLTDEWDNHSAQLVNDIVEALVAVTAPTDDIPWNRELILMRGNHDYVDPTCPFFKFTDEIEGIKWINEPEQHEVGEFYAAFLPHTRDYKKDWERCGVPLKTKDVIFAHNTFAGTVSESGKELGGIPTSVFPKGVPVISGDIHHPQTVGPVTYVGSPYTIDFGDGFQPRVLLLDRDGPPISISCAGTQKVLIQATDFQHAMDHLKVARVNHNIIKLRVAVAPADKDRWPTIKRELMDEAVKLGVWLHTVEPLLEQPVGDRKRYRTKGKSLRDDETLRAYCKQQGVERDREDAGLEIMKG